MQSFILMQNTCIGGEFLEKVPFLADIECFPKYLDYDLYISLLVSLVVKWFVKVGDDISVNFLC